jgi:hypothetical protein
MQIYSLSRSIRELHRGAGVQLLSKLFVECNAKAEVGTVRTENSTSHV